MFNLQGVPCGFVRSAEGGDAVGDVVEEGPKSGAFTKKHIGQVKYEPVELSFGFGMTRDIYEWIEASWKQNYARKDGSVVVTDPSFQAVSAREFYHALITEVTIPDLDASSKDAAHLTLKFAPEYTRDVKASGKVNAPKTPAQKQFAASNFQFELDELPGARVSKIESFTVKQPVVTDDVGSVRDAPQEPGRIDFPNLRVTISELDAGPWGDWAQDFLVKGNNDDSHEKRGAIVFLSPNRKTELGADRPAQRRHLRVPARGGAGGEPGPARRRRSLLRADGVPGREAGPRAGARSAAAPHAGSLAAREPAAALRLGRCVVELVVVVEGGLVRLRELAALQRDVRALPTCSLVTGTWRLSGPMVIPVSGTKVRWRPMKPSFTVPNCGSSVSTSK